MTQPKLITGNAETCADCIDLLYKFDYISEELKINLTGMTGSRNILVYEYIVIGFIAKVISVKMIKALRRQYGRKYASLMPTNLYGQNDNPDLRTTIYI